MRLHRFYVGNENLENYLNSGENFALTDENLIHQLRSVFRFGAGQEIILFNGSVFDFLSEICADENHPRKSSGKFLSIKIKEKIKKEMASQKEIILFQSLIKKDHFELVAEKATELGVSKIVPILSERSEKKGINSSRLKKIVIEATEQSGRNIIPSISGVVSLREAMGKTGNSLVIAFDPTGRPFHDFLSLDKAGDNGSISAFIGPEGGWSGEELEFFKKNGAKLFSLGPSILRSETAAIAVLSILLL